MVIFRENSEDTYAGIEWEAESESAKKVINFLIIEMGITNIRFPKTSGIGIKPVSQEGTERFVRKAPICDRYKRSSITLVHKGNIMKFTEGVFKSWGYAIAAREFGAELLDDGPWMKLPADMGGIGIASGANLSDSTAIFEATHGTALKYAGKDQVNPGSIILSAEMML